MFLRALELDEPQRAAFIRERCDGNGSLAEAVNRLLAHDSTAEMTRGGAVRTDSAEWTGRLAGPYRILGLIGHGGMGAVYKAERQDSFHKVAALKMLRFDLGDEAGRSRFRRERQILALLEHPYIARLLDGGATPDGSPYLVMEYVDGFPLTKYTSTLPIAERIHVFRKVCEAVHYAHQRLVIHRDIKPGNILVLPDGTPKLLDFGIAKLVETSDDGSPHTVTRIMTPEYASPEQLRGEMVSTATDVYALGCVLYEVLSGERAQKLQSRDPAELVRVVCQSEPPAPSSTGPRELRGDLDNIVMRAIRKDPARRYETAAQLSDDLGRYLDGRPVLARPDTFGYRAGKYVRRNRWGLLAVACVFVALLGGLLVARRQARIAETRFAQVRTLSRRILFDVYDSLIPMAGSLKPRQLVVTTALEYLNSLANDAVNDPGLAWEVAEAYTRVATVQGLDGIHLGQRREAVGTANKALALQEGLLARGLLSPAQRELMVQTYSIQVPPLLLFDRAAARRAAEKAVKLAADLSPVARAKALRSLGQVQASEGKPEEALATYDQAIRPLKAAVTGASPPSEWRTLESVTNSRSRVLILLGRLEEALAGFEQCRGIAERLAALEPANPQHKTALINDYEMLGTVLGMPDRPNLGRPAEAVAMMDRELVLLREQRGLEPGSGELLRSECIAWGKRAAMLPSPREALASLENCGRLIGSMVDANERDQIYTSYMSDKALYLLQLGRKSESRETRKALCESTEAHVLDEPDDMVGLRSWGECLMDTAEFELRHGDLAQGRPLLKRALDILKRADEAMPGDPRYLAARVKALGLEGAYLAKTGAATEAARLRTETQALLDSRVAEHPGAKAIRAIAEKHRAGK